MSHTSRIVFNIPEFQDLNWMEHAKCRDLPHHVAMSLFFPDKGQSWREGRLFCKGKDETNDSPAMQQCPVINECLNYALSFEPEGLVGIWGGTSPSERHNMMKPLEPPEPPVKRTYRNMDLLPELIELVSKVNRQADTLEP